MATPESQRYLQWYDQMYASVYVPAYTNGGSFFFGLCGGILYVRAKQERLGFGEGKLLRVLFWTVLPVGLALLMSGHVFYAYDWAKPSLASAAYAAGQKSVWGANITIMIVAMAFGIGCELVESVGFCVRYS